MLIGTEPVISKKVILTTLKDGQWVLDDLSPSILEKIQSDEYFRRTENEVNDFSLKNYAISYYCKIKSPLTSLFYGQLNDENFNQLVVTKIAKEGLITEFTKDEQGKIEVSLEYIKEIDLGCAQFIKELSFIKMNSTQFKSATNPHLIGAIILTNQINYNESYELTRSIVHELAHLELLFFERGDH